MRGTIRAVVPQVYEHTHNIPTSLLSSTISPTQTHILPTRSTTPHPSAITSHRIFSRTIGQGRSHLAGTLDAALTYLVAQVVVTWPVSSVLLFFLTTRFISYWRLGVPSRDRRTLDGYFIPFRETWTFNLFSFLLSLFCSSLGSFFHHT